MKVSQMPEKTKAAKVRVAKDIRADEWEEIIRAQRSSGKSIKNWCRENGISSSANYRRQKETCSSARQEKDGNSVEVVKLAAGQNPQGKLLPEEESTASKAQSIKMIREGINIEASIEISEEEIMKLLRVMRNAW